MDASWEVRHALKFLTVVIFLSTAVSVCAFLIIPDPFVPSWRGVLGLGAALSPLVFLGACILIFLKPRFGYTLGLLASSIALPFFVSAEVSLAPWNSWIFLNEDSSRGAPAFVALRILRLALLALAIAVSSVRLLPANWSARGTPLCRRTWPSFALITLMLAAWFAHSTLPYRVPAYDHPANFEFRILHIQKRGLRLHQVAVCGYRDGRAWVMRHDRQLFQYQFEERGAIVILRDATLERARAFFHSPELSKSGATPAKPLWSWNAEGWYVVLKDAQLLAFTTEYRTAPPDEVTALFNEVEALSPWAEWPLHVRDVCLGFCYDPVAALGFSVLQQRIRLLTGQVHQAR
jgi:hypothetical protein